MGKLHIDLTFQNRYLLNGVEVRLRLIRTKDLFCLHENANQAQNKVSLKEVTLFVRKASKTKPAVQLAHVKALQHATAKYPLRGVQVKSFTVLTGNRTITKENLFLGQLPIQLVVGVVDNDAYNGVITKSPFHFKHNNINFMTIYRDGVQILPNRCNRILPTIVLFDVIFVCLHKRVNIIATRGTLFCENSTRTVVPCLLSISRLRWIQVKSVSN